MRFLSLEQAADSATCCEQLVVSAGFASGLPGAADHRALPPLEGQCHSES